MNHLARISGWLFFSCWCSSWSCIIRKLFHLPAFTLVQYTLDGALQPGRLKYFLQGGVFFWGAVVGYLKCLTRRYFVFIRREIRWDWEYTLVTYWNYTLDTYHLSTCKYITYMYTLMGVSQTYAPCSLQIPTWRSFLDWTPWCSFHVSLTFGSFAIIHFQIGVMMFFWMLISNS